MTKRVLIKHLLRTKCCTGDTAAHEQDEVPAGGVGLTGDWRPGWREGECAQHLFSSPFLSLQPWRAGALLRPAARSWVEG